MSPPLAAAPAVPEHTDVSASGLTAWRGWRDGLSYGALGLPLAFVALPLYVVLPNHYASQFGVSLAALGALLLSVRLVDAVADPWIGRWCDRRFGSAHTALWAVLVTAAVVLAAGFHGLFFPPAFVGRTQSVGLMLWCALALTITYLAYSVLSIAHQAWGARLGGHDAHRARVVSWREGLSLVGVMSASVLPSLAGMSGTSAVFAVLLAVALMALRWAPQPVSRSPRQATQRQQDTSLTGQRAAPHSPWACAAFRRLIGIFLLNGIASAVPATLVLFFIRDRLQSPQMEPLFLASYFAAAALSMPLWVRLVSRWGLPRAWATGMVMAVAAFCWAALLGAGDVAAYAAVCVASGVALGADLVVPPAMLAGVVQREGAAGQREGAYFGWWNFATKLNLALAAGVSLPLLALLGYSPGDRDEASLQVLTLAYCVLPCVLKLLAVGALYGVFLIGERR